MESFILALQISVALCYACFGCTAAFALHTSFADLSKRTGDLGVVVSDGRQKTADHPLGKCDWAQ